MDDKLIFNWGTLFPAFHPPLEQTDGSTDTVDALLFLAHYHKRRHDLHTATLYCNRLLDMGGRVCERTKRDGKRRKDRGERRDRVRLTFFGHHDRSKKKRKLCFEKSAVWKVKRRKKKRNGDGASVHFQSSIMTRALVFLPSPRIYHQQPLPRRLITAVVLGE